MLSLTQNNSPGCNELFNNCNKFLQIYFMKCTNINQLWLDYLNLDPQEIMKTICDKMSQIITAYICTKLNYTCNISIAPIPNLHEKFQTPIYIYSMITSTIIIFYDHDYLIKMFSEIDALRYLLYDNISTLKVDREKFNNFQDKKYQLDLEISTHLNLLNDSHKQQQQQQQQQPIIFRNLRKGNANRLNLTSALLQNNQQQDISVFEEQQPHYQQHHYQQEQQNPLILQKKIQNIFIELNRNVEMSKNLNINIMLYFIVQLQKAIDIYYTIKNEKNTLVNNVDINVRIKNTISEYNIQVNRIKLELKNHEQSMGD